MSYMYCPSCGTLVSWPIPTTTPGWYCPTCSICTVQPKQMGRDSAAYSLALRRDYKNWEKVRMAQELGMEHSWPH